LNNNRITNITVPGFWLTIIDKIEKAKSSINKPIMVIDIDGTISQHYLRTYEIFLRAAETFDLPEDVKTNLTNYDPYRYDYYPRKNLLQMGFREGETLSSVMEFWEKNFFSNNFLHLDEPIPGAREFIGIALGLGVNAVYLSGRDEQNMGDGTRAWLRSHSFLGNHSPASIFLKTNLSISSVESKIVAAEKIKSLGEPLLIIDNEPGELEALWRQFPQAAAVLLDTPNSGRPGTLPPGTLKIKNFLEINSMYK
jgi:hypothetical protein